MRNLLLLLVALLLAAPSHADRTEWSESGETKTKTVYDDAGNIVYQAHWDRRSGALQGKPLDLRAPAAPAARAASPPASRRPAARKDADPDVRFERRDDHLYLVADSLVRIRFDTALHSGRNRRGDSFQYTLLDAVKHGDRTLLAAGSRGRGLVKDARRRGAFGRSGRLQLDFGTVTLASGGRVRLTVNKRAEAANEKTAIAAGTSGAGLLILGPIGLAGGAFIKGRDVSIEPGTVSWVAVAEDVVVED